MSLHPEVAKWIENEFRLRLRDECSKPENKAVFLHCLDSGDSLADSLSIAATYIVLGIAGMQHVLDESEV